MLRPAVIDDAFALAPRLRLEDIEEVKAAGHHDMDVVLAEGVVSGESWAFEVDGVVHAIMGCTSGGVVWLLGSYDLFSFKRELMTLPSQFLPRWVKTYRVIGNMVHAKNTRSIRWLKRLGFTIHEQHNHQGHPFHYFTMGTRDV